MHATKVSKVTVEREREAPRGWSYEVVLLHTDGQETAHTVTLHWADHEYWCGGRLPPSKVVEGVLRYLMDHGLASPWPEKFDAARARRWMPEIDRDLPGTI